MRRLRSSYNRAALLIRFSELWDQPFFRAARGAKAETEANPTQDQPVPAASTEGDNHLRLSR